MASHDGRSLRARSRRAYELGRLRTAISRSWLIAPLTSASLLWCGNPGLTVVLAGLLFGLAVGFLWRGQAWGRAVVPSLLAGGVPAMTPILSQATGHCCAGGSCWDVCVMGCLLGGTVAGGLLGWRAARQDSDRAVFMVAGGLVLSLTGALGCMRLGPIGVLGMLGGFALGSIPVLVTASLRRV